MFSTGSVWNLLKVCCLLLPKDNYSPNFVFPAHIRGDLEAPRNWADKSLIGSQRQSLIKGQLISECILGVIDFPKKQRKFWQISALDSKKWSNQQSESTFL